MAVLLFLLFAAVFCHFMNKWSRELEEIETQEEVVGGNVTVANFAEKRTGAYDVKRAA